jgi:hypothetical protein
VTLAPVVGALSQASHSGYTQDERCYDVNYADKFEILFKGLYIGEYPTPEHNYFAIL